jgi:hypothetical protein
LWSVDLAACGRRFVNRRASAGRRRGWLQHRWCARRVERSTREVASRGVDGCCCCCCRCCCQQSPRLLRAERARSGAGRRGQGA